MDEFLSQIEKHKSEFYAYIYRNVWDSSMADDVFSEAVLAAYKSRANFIPGTNFRAWMYRILTNKCFVINREIGRRGVSMDEFEGSAMEEDPGDNSSWKTVDVDEFLAQCGDELQIAMRKLSTMERSCLLLKVMQKFSYKEIAEVVEIPYGTVMTHLARGRAKLKKELVQYAGGFGIEDKRSKKNKAEDLGIRRVGE